MTEVEIPASCAKALDAANQYRFSPEYGGSPSDVGAAFGVCFKEETVGRFNPSSPFYELARIIHQNR